MPDNLTNETILPELYFLIANFLKNSPFQETSQLFIRQLEQYRVLPPRIDWTGARHERSFEEMSESLTHIPPNFLLQMCNQIRNLIENQLDINFSSLNSLFGIGQFSVLQDVQKQKKKQENQLNKFSNIDALPKDFYLKYHSTKNYNNHSTKCKNGGVNLILNLHKRQLDGRELTTGFIQPDHFRSVNIQKRIFGHLSAVYCVCFDRTGRYILTGADDNLIKAWSVHDGRLLATFRGHEKEISDIDINFENNLLASGSCDKTLRIWNLKTTGCMSILQGHSSMVTSIEFSPYCRGYTRWLASSGSDGVICFWYWNSETLEFNSKPRKFIEKSRPGSQMLCLSFSSGGLFLAAGSNDHAIRVYCFESGEPSKICELESHSNWVDSIQYANISARFLSGSKDGTAKIWSFESQQWKNILIDGSKTLRNSDSCEFLNSDFSKKYSVTMVAWNCDDSLVVTAQNNFIIKIWNSHDAVLVHELKAHTNEIFVLEAHPKDPRLLLSAGHDGNVILWNILTGKLIKKFYNKIENEGHGCLFDTKWSSTMDMFASTDSHGNLTIFGFGLDDNFKKVPDQLFFHTDYRPLMRDSNGFVLDEQTQIAPHLMPPPFLVNADGNPYDADLQRLVPGRENLTDAQLIPHIITNENGVSEIIGDREGDENEEQTRQRNQNAWVKNLITPLDKAILKTSEMSRIENLELEEKNYSRELKEIDTNQKGSVYIYRDENSNMKRGRGKGKKSKPDEIENMEEDTMEDQFIDVDDDSTRQSLDRNRQRRVFYIDSNQLASESSHHSDCSEWEDRPSTRATTRQKKKTRKRVLKVEDDDEQEELKINIKIESDAEDQNVEENTEQPDELDSEFYSDDLEDFDYEENDENADPNKPCTSKSTKSPRKKIKKQKSKRGKPKVNGSAIKQKLVKSNSKLSKLNISSEVEVPSEYLPPEWLTSTRPRKTPYVPQIGDEIVYFRQGHELYIQAVRDRNLYVIEEKTLPSNKCKVVEFCRIVNIKIEIKPPRLVCLKLNLIDEETSELTGQKLTIKYHDINGVVDFVILRQHYEKSLKNHWRSKDKFRCLIDDSWYYGTIESRKPFQEEHPGSPFQSLNVLWDNNETEALSPWDLEETPSRKTKPTTENIPATPEELRSLLYEPNLEEWGGIDRDIECERIVNGIQNIMGLSIAEPFNMPVDLVAFSSYAMIIGYPIDLNTIKERVSNRYYRRLEAIEWDAKKIEENAHAFNEPDSDIVKKATLLTKVLIEFINDSDCSNPYPIYKRLNKDQDLNMTQTSPNMGRRGQRKSKAEAQNTTTTNLRFNLRSRQNIDESNQGEQESTSNGTFSWRDEAKKLIASIMRHPDSTPFRQEVDYVQYPDYLDIVKNPIDFNTIRQRIMFNFYSNDDFNTFDKDCKKVFSNSKIYNTNNRSKIYSMTLRLQTFYEERIGDIRKRYETDKADRVKHGRSSRRMQNQNNHADEGPNFGKMFKNGIIKSESVVNGINKNNSSLNSSISVCPSTSGYATRSLSNKKLKSMNSNSNHDDNSHLSDYDNDDLTGKSNDILNKSIIDEDTQMGLFDNIEYDLNEEYQSSIKTKNSKLTRSQATNFSNLDFSIKTEPSDSIECKPGTSKIETNKKTRLGRIESNTVLSDTDDTPIKNGRNKKIKNKIKVESEEEDFMIKKEESSDQEFDESRKEEDEDEDFNRRPSRSKNKKKSSKEDVYDDDLSENTSQNLDGDIEEDEEDYEDDSFNAKKSKKSKKTKRNRTDKSSNKNPRATRSSRPLDNKENNESIITRPRKQTSTKSASNTEIHPARRSSKRARKTDYREFSTSEDFSVDEENDDRINNKRSSSRKKPKFSSSENLNF